ncbi:MAG: helix-turn-helix transcriptional regulator [Candidatus Glassbacteria bacterium]|nr:helix-turn-helix transcriptional regulator [Candidatus Glassbacteria bacterium]
MRQKNPKPPRLNYQGYVTALRKKRKISQAVFAERLGVSLGAVGIWEYGRGTPKYDTAIKLIALDPELAKKYELPEKEEDQKESKTPWGRQERHDRIAAAEKGEERPAAAVEPAVKPGPKRREVIAEELLQEQEAKQPASSETSPSGIRQHPQPVTRRPAKKETCCDGMEALREVFRSLKVPLQILANSAKSADLWDSEIKTLSHEVTALDKRLERLEHGLRALLALEVK